MAKMTQLMNGTDYITLLCIYMYILVCIIGLVIFVVLFVNQILLLNREQSIKGRNEKNEESRRRFGITIAIIFFIFQ